MNTDLGQVGISNPSIVGGLLQALYESERGLNA